MVPLPSQQQQSQWSKDINDYPWICEVRVPCGKKMVLPGVVGEESNVGTGVHFLTASDDGRQIGRVLTACHTFRMSNGTIARAGKCKFPANSVELNCTVIDYDADEDWALLRLHNAPPMMATSVADGPPEIGEHVALVGLAPPGFRAVSATVKEKWPDGFWTTVGSRQGDSGGAVLDSDGRLCGIITGTDKATESYTLACDRFFGRIVGCPPRYRPPTHQRPQQPIVNAPSTVKGDPGPQGPRGPQGEKGDPGEVSEAHIAAMTAAILQALKSDEAFLATVKGEAGPQGQPGAPATVDYEQINIAIAQALQSQGITVRTIDTEGNVLDSEFIPLGGVLNIQHKPIK